MTLTDWRTRRELPDYTVTPEWVVYHLIEHDNVHRIDLDTFAENERAIRTYKKCGLVVEGVRRKAMWTINGYRDQVMMGLLREDWDAQQ